MRKRFWWILQTLKLSAKCPMSLFTTLTALWRSQYLNFKFPWLLIISFCVVVRLEIVNGFMVFAFSQVMTLKRCSIAPSQDKKDLRWSWQQINISLLLLWSRSHYPYSLVFTMLYIHIISVKMLMHTYYTILNQLGMLVVSCRQAPGFCSWWILFLFHFWSLLKWSNLFKRNSLHGIIWFTTQKKIKNLKCSPPIWMKNWVWSTISSLIKLARLLKTLWNSRNAQLDP